MATRSEIIVKAQKKIVTGGATGAAADQFYTFEHWNDWFHLACEMVHRELIEADLRYFITEVAIAPVAGVYPLPADFYALIWLKDATNNSNIYSADDMEEEEQDVEGFMIENSDIRLTNFRSNPTSITLKYFRTPKEIGDWLGTTDTVDAAHTPDAPLDSASAARLLSELIVVLARTKDEALTAEQQGVAELMISNFVDRLGTRIQMDPIMLGERY